MRNILNRKILSLTLAAILALGNLGAGASPVFADGEEKSDIEKLRERVENLCNLSQPASNLTPGHIPDNIHFRDLEKNLVNTGETPAPRRLRSTAMLPSAWPEGGCSNSAIVLEYLTEHFPATRDQQPFGTCWAFATIAMAEFYNLTHGYETDPAETDYSEYHLAYWTHTDGTGKTLNGGGAADTINFQGDRKTVMMDGGNTALGLLTLLRERGVTRESDFPYPTTTSAITELPPESERGYNAFLLNDAVAFLFYEGDDPSARFGLAKEAILANGCIATSVYVDVPYYNIEHNSFYCYDDIGGVNHGLVLVGWDDNFPKENFSTDAALQPPKDGAWLVRNSWSDQAAWSPFSYYWMSYYDKVMINEPALTVSMMEPGHGYDNNYYYDTETHERAKMLENSQVETMRTANVFTACGKKGSELISAVRFVFEPDDEGDDGKDYQIRIYRGTTTEGGLNLGTLCSDAVTGGKIYATGFYTVPLENPVLVTKGENFAIEVEIEGKTSVCYEREGYVYDGRSWIEYVPAVARGETWYYSADDGRWNDILDETDSGVSFRTMGFGNAMISALTKDVEPKKKHKRHSSGNVESPVAATENKPETQTEQPENPNEESLSPQEGEQQAQMGSAGSIFTDVPADSWAANSIKKIVSMGIMKGTGNGKFSPYALMSRGMLSEVFKNLAGGDSAEEGGFGDTAGKWYAKSAAWVKAHNIMGGIGGGLFAGDDPVEREQMMTGYYRLALLQGKVTEEAKAQAKEALSAYPDAGSVSEYAREAMGWGLVSGMLKGMNGRLNPHGKADRAQFCALTERYCGL